MGKSQVSGRKQRQAKVPCSLSAWHKIIPADLAHLGHWNAETGEAGRSFAGAPQSADTLYFVNRGIMKKEHFLIVATSLATLLIALALLRWLAPGLLGVPQSVPMDLKLVRLSREVPPFYENIFSREDKVREDNYLINDPLIHVRAPNFFPDIGEMGPNDVLGFRNRAVPNVADVIVIGDSQTYGNNAHFEFNWPSQLRRRLAATGAQVYAMATGGWTGIQYMQAVKYARKFQPRVIIVAFYSGNDAMESFTLAYGNERWGSLRPDPGLTEDDAPKVEFPPPENERWPVRFADGVQTIFTPGLRHTSNDRSLAAVRAGYAVLARTAERIASYAGDSKLIMTVIPTKEQVYENKVAAEKLSPPAAYNRLVADEKANIAGLAAKLAKLPGVTYVDLVAPLQNAAMTNIALYPTNWDGHPVDEGYAKIADAIAKAMKGMVRKMPFGPVFLQVASKEKPVLFVKNGHYFTIRSKSLLTENGWPTDVAYPLLSRRDLAALTLGGAVTVGPDFSSPEK